MRVRAAKTKRADAGEARAFATWPRALGVDDLGDRVGPIDVRVRRFKVQVGGQVFVAEREHGANQTGNAGGRLQVTDLGFDGADEQRLVARLGFEDGVERRDLDRVAEASAGAVGFDVINGVGFDARVGERLADDGFLRGAARDGQARARAVLVDRGAAHQREDRVAVGFGAREAFEHDHAGAFGAHVAVGFRVERLAAPVGRQHRRFAHADRAERIEQRVHTADDRRGALTAAQAERRFVQRD